MPTEIRMPRLVDSMTEGAVVAWRTREGESVTAGEVIAEIEVDKTTADLQAPDSGTLTKIVVPAGSEKVEVGAVLAVLEQNGPALAVVREPASASLGPTNGGYVEVEEPAKTAPHLVGGSVEPMAALRQVAVQASPLARSMALQAGLDLSSVCGSGPRGRVVRADVLAALGLHQATRESRSTDPVHTSGRPLSEASPSYDLVPHTQVRQVIAQRLSESKRVIPHFYLEVNSRVDALLQLRSEIQATCTDGTRLSLNDFAIRAAALALRKDPEANASWTDTATLRYRRIDLAIAVATSLGVVAPVVRDADRKGLAELAAEVRDLAARARDGRLTPAELRGGTFTVSNLGMYGIDSLYAIVNPPQAGILGLGAAQPRPIVVDGAIVAATMMTCTLSADHRVLDGAAGARFLLTFKRLIEQPLTMML